ncbi:MAG: LLM class flavin-dependent oxidoreductase [Nostocoides sp.]
MSILKIGIPGTQLPSSDPTRAVRRAEDDGFHSIWWADRLMGWLPAGPHELLDPYVVMAIAAQATSRIQLGTAVSDPLRRHPAQLAQTALSVQAVSRGRLLLGLGSGEAAGTVPYGMTFNRPVSRLQSAILTLRALWDGGGVVTRGDEFYPLQDALCGLASVIDAPPIWIASHGPRALRITGRLADGWMPTAAGVDRYRADLEAIRTAEASAGRARGAVTAGAFAWCVAAESEERARALLATPQLRALGLLLPAGALPKSPLPNGPAGSLVPTRANLGDLVAPIDVDALAVVIPHGTPTQIADRLAALHHAGAEHIVICDMSRVSGQDNGLGLRPHEIHLAIREALMDHVSVADDGR